MPRVERSDRLQLDDHYVFNEDIREV